MLLTINVFLIVIPHVKSVLPLKMLLNVPLVKMGISLIQDIVNLVLLFVKLVTMVVLVKIVNLDTP